MLGSIARLQVRAALLTKVCMEPYKQLGSTCSGGSPLVLGQVDPLGPPVLGSVARGSTGPGVHQSGGSTVPPTPVSE